MRKLREGGKKAQSLLLTNEILGIHYCQTHCEPINFHTLYKKKSDMTQLERELHFIKMYMLPFIPINHFFPLWLSCLTASLISRKAASRCIVHLDSDLSLSVPSMHSPKTHFVTRFCHFQVWRIIPIVSTVIIVRIFEEWWGTMCTDVRVCSCGYSKASELPQCSPSPVYYEII